MRALGGAPEADTAATIRDGRTTVPSLVSGADARIAGQIPRTTRAANATRGSADEEQGVEIEARIGIGQPGLAHQGEDRQGGCEANCPDHPDERQQDRADHGEGEELPSGGAEGSEGRVVLRIDGVLARQCLRQDDHSDQRGQPGQDPPPDDLGSMDVAIELPSAERSSDPPRPVLVRAASNRRMSRVPWRSRNEVLVEEHGARVVLLRECPRGVEVVGRLWRPTGIRIQRPAIPTTRNATVGPCGRRGRVVHDTAARCVDEASGTWITVPMWTPRGRGFPRPAPVPDRTGPGSRPLSSLTRWVSCAGETSWTLKSLSLIWLAHESQAGGPTAGDVIATALDARPAARRLVDRARGVGEGVVPVCGLEA